ncbi:RIC1 protein [Ostertagia ostertagi]
MYIPVDRETKFRLPVPGEDGDLREHRAIKCIASNREKFFMAVVTSDCIYIWLAHTSRNNLLIYRVVVSGENCYNLIDPPDVQLRRCSQELFLRGPRPSITLAPSVVVNLAASATCCVPLREELFVCLRNGFIHHISWEGQVRAEYSIRLPTVPFAHDQLQSKPDFVTDPAAHVVDAVYAPLVGGYCIVLSDGRAALLTSSDSRFHPSSILGVWALNMKDATCSDVNHKFRLLTFGCANGDVAAYHLDDANGSLVQTFRVALKVQNGPDVVNRVGSVSDIEVLTNGGAFVAVWSSKTSTNNGTDASSSHLPATLAVFTPFGTQTWCSLESIQDSDGAPAVSYTSVDWGPEGYHLWLGRSDGLSILPMARSAALCNPIMDHSNHIVLICSSRVLISSNREREGVASAPHAVWTAVNPLHEYLASNWPIRFAAVDRDSAKHLVVAGLRGLAHCSLPGVRWKIFGNESHESSLMVTGGVLIWGGTVGTACYDLDSCREQLRFYPINKKLDNRYASIFELECRVIMMSLRSDALVTFDIEGRIIMHRLMRNEESAGDIVKISVDRIAEIRVGDLVTHPACLVSIHLTQLSLDPSASFFFPGVDTVLINVSGRLLTLNPHKASKEVTSDESFQLNQPIMVASFVEQVWHCRALTAREPPGLPHLLNALWINCGSRGMRVWLPLISGRRGIVSQDTSFISKRIMLPFELDICPLVNMFKRLSGYRCGKFAVFAHHILRQLLKRNLGVFALEVAAACRHLPHFAHSLELLLHGIHYFLDVWLRPFPPEFLRTVAHCARKTELALWSSLFAVTGSPNDLFEVCLRDGQLHTAASYLIVLQSIENTQTSQEQALRLLREALSAGEWSIAKDMVRGEGGVRCDSLVPLGRRIWIALQGARIAKVRHSHAETRELNRKDSAGSGKRVNRHASNDIGPPSPTQLNPVAEKMGAILERYFVSALELDTSRILVSSRKFVHNFPNALTRLHSQFAWPYPVASKKVVDQLEKMFGSMRCSQSAACLNGGPSTELKKTPIQSIPVAAAIMPHPDQYWGRLVVAQLTTSTRGSIGSDWHGLLLLSHLYLHGMTVEFKGLKLLVGETSNKGSAESLAQMSHLMSWFSTAGCLDWMFLICVVSRDIVQLRREINPESAQKAGVDAFKHTMFGCDDLLEWARQNW